MWKRLTALLIGFSLIGCATTRIQEDILYKTKTYCGTFVSQSQEKHYVKILTSEAVLKVDETIDAPVGARCYFHLVPERIVGTASESFVLYFTWDGTDKEYRVMCNFITGELL